MRRVLAKIDNLRLRELFLVADDFRRNQFAVDRERNKNRLAVFARDAFAAKGDIFDLQIDNAHAINTVLQDGVLCEPIVINRFSGFYAAVENH